MVCSHGIEESVPGPRSARPVEASIGSAQCEDDRIIQLLIVLDVRELVQHNHVQGLATDRIRIVRQSLYHRPVSKREPPFRGGPSSTSRPSLDKSLEILSTIFRLCRLLGATIAALNPFRVRALKRTATAIARLLPLCLDHRARMNWLLSRKSFS